MTSFDESGTLALADDVTVAAERLADTSVPNAVDTAAPVQATTPLDSSDGAEASVEVSATSADATADGKTAADTPSLFAEFGLDADLLAAIADLGYTEPTTVQAQAIPLAMPQDDAPLNDLMVSSETGSGKTAAYLLPVLQGLIQQQRATARKAKADWEAQVALALAKGEPAPKKPKRHNPKNSRHFQPAVPGALVLAPTRELAQQVAHDAIALVRHCRGIRIATVVGGMPYGRQIQELQNASLVVATPGRLLDLQRSGQLKLHGVQTMVVDEADRMLDLGFADALAAIHQLTEQRRQTLMFSATFEAPIQRLALRVMRQEGAHVQRLQIDTPRASQENIRQELYWADNADHKRQLLDYWLRDPSIDQAIVFACTQIECDALANELYHAGFAAAALHGGMPQSVRNRRLYALRSGKIQILVATDVAARGIDVPTITHVFNYGLPMKAEDYTHRIGRTGRAGREGLAITLAEIHDRRRLAAIETFTQKPFVPLVIDGLEPTHDFPPIRAPRRSPAPGRRKAPGAHAKKSKGPIWNQTAAKRPGAHPGKRAPFKKSKAGTRSRG